MQKKDYGKFHPIQFAIPTMKDAGRRFATYVKEALSVIFALNKFLVYLLSSLPLKLLTDHKYLIYLQEEVYTRACGKLDGFSCEA